MATQGDFGGTEGWDNVWVGENRPAPAHRTVLQGTKKGWRRTRTGNKAGEAARRRISDPQMSKNLVSIQLHLCRACDSLAQLFQERKPKAWPRDVKAEAKRRCCQGHFSHLSKLPSHGERWGDFPPTFPLGLTFAFMGFEASLFTAANLNIVLCVYSNLYAKVVVACLIYFFPTASNSLTYFGINQEHIPQHWQILGSYNPCGGRTGLSVFINSERKYISLRTAFTFHVGSLAMVSNKRRNAFLFKKHWKHLAGWHHR